MSVLSLGATILTLAITGGGDAELSLAVASTFVAVTSICVFSNGRHRCSQPLQYKTLNEAEKYLYLMWLLITLCLFSRFGLSINSGNTLDRLIVGSHWLGFPTKLDVTVYVWISWTLGMLVIFSVRQFTHGMLLHLGWLMTGIVLVEFFVGVYGFVNNDPTVLGSVTRDNPKAFSGTFVNRNTYSYFIATSLPFILSCLVSRSRKHNTPGILIAIFVFTISIISIVWSQSRMGSIAVLMSVGIWFWLHLKSHQFQSRTIVITTFLTLMFLLLVIVAAGPDQLLRRFEVIGKSTTRFEMLKAVFDLPVEYWLIGIGVGNLSQTLHQLLPPNMSPQHLDYLHNDFLQFVLEFGLIASSLFGILLVQCFRKAMVFPLNSLQRGAACGIVGGTTGALVDFPLHVPCVGLMFCCLFGILLGYRPTKINAGINTIQGNKPRRRSE